MKVGDIVRIHDGSWNMGIKDGKLQNICALAMAGRNRERRYRVLSKGSFPSKPDVTGMSASCNDLAVIGIDPDNEGMLVFTRERFCNVMKMQAPTKPHPAEPWQVDCKDGDVYRALVELARGKGWKGSAINILCNWRWLIMQNSGYGTSRLDGHDRYYRGRVITLDEAVDRIIAGPPKPSPKIIAKVADHDVWLNPDGSLRFGCTTISSETVREMVIAIQAKGGTK